MKVYIGVKLDEEKARRLAELLSQGVEEVNQEPPKLVVEEEKHLVLPGLLLVEERKDVEGKLVYEGRVLPPTNNCVIEESEIGKAGELSTSWV